MANAAANGAAKAASGVSYKQHAYNWGPGIALIISIGLFIGTFFQFNSLTGGTDHWVNIQSQVMGILAQVIIGTILFMMGALGYFFQEPTKAVYFGIVVSCIALGIAYGALAVAVITR